MARNRSQRLRILIFGGDGMLGHQLLRQFGGTHATRVTLRAGASQYRDLGLFNSGNAYFGVDVRHFGQVERVVRSFRPDAAVNAVGIVKQRADTDDPVLNTEVNALFPHRLARLCDETGARLIHLSTDCVFSGAKGKYRESDSPDAVDVYGRSKLLGEVGYAPGLTLRTSMIGLELRRKGGLLEWFLAQRATVKGYRNAIFSGFTTRELARIVEMLLVRHPAASGLYHVSAAAISKYDLLALVKRKLGLKIRIAPDRGVRIDRSLDSGRFRREFGYRPPSWETMIAELARDMRGKR